MGINKMIMVGKSANKSHWRLLKYESKTPKMQKLQKMKIPVGEDLGDSCTIRFADSVHNTRSLGEEERSSFRDHSLHTLMVEGDNQIGYRSLRFWRSPFQEAAGFALEDN